MTNQSHTPTPFLTAGYTRGSARWSDVAVAAYERGWDDAAAHNGRVAVCESRYYHMGASDWLHNEKQMRAAKDDHDYRMSVTKVDSK